ncbi:hypothetical protein F5884DRAFT_627227, partial [Xylogone sp. PMI_703]
SQLQHCPDNCLALGTNPGNWTIIHDAQKLSYCNQTVLFDLSLHNTLDDPKTHTTIRACT